MIRVKYKNKAIDRPKPEVVVIPRGDESIVFTFVAITDFSDFDRVSPDPEIPVKVFASGKSVPDPENPEYMNAMLENNKRRNVWMIWQSIVRGTPDVTFEKLTIDPSTWVWANLENEFSDSGFTRAEFAKISSVALVACGLSMEKIEEATKTFLAQRAAAEKE